VTVTPHLKAIVLAGGLAALALALGFMTLSMNQPSSSDATPKAIMPLHLRKTKAEPTVKPKVVHRAAPDPNVVAAKEAGLPAQIAAQLGPHRVVVVELYTAGDQVDDLARGEAAAGAALAGAGFVAVRVEQDKVSATLTKLLGALPPAPAALVYSRPATLYVTLPGFNDRTTVQQAATNADPTPGAVTAVASDWAAHANALCKRTLTKAKALGGVQADRALLRSKPKFDALMRGFLVDLRQLKPAAGQHARVATLNGLFAQNLVLTDAMLTAIAHKDLTALGAATTKQGAGGDRLAELERQLGATACTDLA
jgi:hypothetical protein